MSYRQPAFMLDNLIGDITDVGNDVWPSAATSPIDNANKRDFIDGRQSSLGTYTATGPFAGVRFDIGALPAVELDRMVIPAGHDLAAANIRVFTSEFSIISPFTQLSNQIIPAGDAVIDQALSSGGVWNFWSIQDNTSFARSYTHGGYWLGHYEQLSADAAVDPGFASSYRSEIVETAYPGGSAVVQLARPRRTFTLSVRDVDSGGADFDILERVLLSREKSFWYWPPDDQAPGPFLVRLRNDGERIHDFAVPSVAMRYRYNLSMVEDLL